MNIDKFVSETLGLTKLPPYLPTFVYSFLAFLAVHQLLGPWLSELCFPSAYGSKSRHARSRWCMHVVSQVHCVVIVPLALWVISTESPGREKDAAFGWDEKAGVAHAIACGYFLWDTMDAILNVTYGEIGFVLHGIACFAIYLMSFKPFVAYYGTRCLLWETSTFLLNIHWFLDKTGRTGTRFQLINGILLILTFFFVRIIYGGLISLHFFCTLLDIYDDVPLSYSLVYGTGNFLLMGLNFFWFYKMIAAIRKRFDKSEERTRLVSESANGDAH